MWPSIFKAKVNRPRRGLLLTRVKLNEERTPQLERANIRTLFPRDPLFGWSVLLRVMRWFRVNWVRFKVEIKMKSEAVWSRRQRLDDYMGMEVVFGQDEIV